jgi:tRNA 2-selenouridine synthase
MELPQLSDYRELFINDTPLLDVRAPIEFLQGAFPHTENFPLMNDDERKHVGIEYKEKGQQEAIALGHQLVSGDVKQQRLVDWQRFFEQHPQGVLYCFRGGLRSRISQQWIYEHTGKIYPRVEGGYKAMRSFLLVELELSCANLQPIILSGRTGVGKTRLLQPLQDKVDLEGLFQHRGSAFGKRVTPQPSQIDAENALSIELLKLRNNGRRRIIIEDESRSIGSRKLPDNFFTLMRGSPVVVVEAEIEERVDTVFEEYIVDALKEYQAAHGEDLGFESWAEHLLESLTKIERRLGGLRFKYVKDIMLDAVFQHTKNDNNEHHKDWIKILLDDYYDPMYDYQLSKKSDRVIFRGEGEATLNYLRREHDIQ